MEGENHYKNPSEFSIQVAPRHYKNRGGALRKRGLGRPGGGAPSYRSLRATPDSQKRETGKSINCSLKDRQVYKL